MAKELKSLEELKKLINDQVERFSVGKIPNAQWVKIVPIDPPDGGVNWKVTHSGASGELSDAIDRVMLNLQKKYDLKE